MGRFGLAFRAFFVVLWNAAAAEAVRQALSRPALPGVSADEKKQPSDGAVGPSPGTSKPAATRSEALTLLAALQREARFVDLVMEPLDTYTDAQIGSAARNVLRDSAAVLSRFFGLKPLESADEGASIEVPAGYDPARYRVVGNVSGNPPFRGRLVHRGWHAETVNLPTWTGKMESSRVVAPAEVEV